MISEVFTFPEDKYRAFPCPYQVTFHQLYFSFAAATGSTITVEGCDMNDSQGDREVVFMLERMGCSSEFEGRNIKLTGSS